MHDFRAKNIAQHRWISTIDHIIVPRASNRRKLCAGGLSCFSAIDRRGTGWGGA
jgi:hypothetical protein